jgi:hypothetical protein
MEKYAKLVAEFDAINGIKGDTVYKIFFVN